MTRAADQALDRVGRRERLTEALREAECQDGQGLLEPFAHARRRTRIAVVESTREILEETSSGRDVGLFVGARHDRADPWTLALGQVAWGLATQGGTFTGGENGLPGVPRPSLGIGGWDLSRSGGFYVFTLLWITLLYRIVKAYYQRAPDKPQALREIYGMRDPKAFLARSGWRPAT